MAEGVSFYKGAEGLGKGPGSTLPDQPAKGKGPVQFFDGAESVDSIVVPTDDPQNVGAVPKKGSPVESELAK
jgi:hypothetical protein